MRHSAVDFALRGDGEIGLPMLAAALRSGNSTDAIPGLVRRQGDGSLSLSPPCAVPDLESLEAYRQYLDNLMRQMGSVLLVRSAQTEDLLETE